MEVAKVRDAKRLEELEAVVKRDLESFYEVGRALVEIREKGLYKIKTWRGVQDVQGVRQGNMGHE